MLEVSRGDRFSGMLLDHMQGLDKNSGVPINVPGIKLNSGFSSGFSEESRIRKEVFSLPSSGERQRGRNMDRKRDTENGHLLLYWGKQKRIRIAKRAMENPPSNLLRNHNTPVQRNDGIDLELQVSSASQDVNWRTKGSTVIAEGRNAVSEIRTKIISTISKDMASCPVEKPSNSSNGSHESKIDNTKPVRNVESNKNSSLESSPAVDPKSNPCLVRLPKITLSLSQKEKEEDFLALKGRKLPRQPKRRSKQAEKALQHVSPGAWLPHLIGDRYEVKDRNPVKMGPRGLKEMDSMGCDSDLTDLQTHCICIPK